MARIRIFIGVSVGTGVINNVTNVQAQLARSGAQVNWVPAENLHLTLLFLGEVHDRDLPELCLVTARAVAPVTPFVIRLQGLGAFPSPRRPKTLWVGIGEGQEGMQELHQRLEPAMIDLGAYRREDRAYTPHLTLGRIKNEEEGNRIAPELDKFSDWVAGHSKVSEVIIFGSELRREGPIYTPLGRAPLRGKSTAPSE